MLFLNIVCMLLVASSYCETVSELCGRYMAFTKPHERLVSNIKYSLGDRYILEGWYGIKDFIIPYSPPGIVSCGTLFPIYLKERPSTSGSIENITACAQGAEGCRLEVQILVLYCSPSLTVYKLTKVPSDYAAYCLRSSKNGEFPDFNTIPFISYKLQDSGLISQIYEIKCGFSNPRNAQLVFKTEWFVNGVSVYESTFTDYEDENKVRTLTDKKLKDANITAVGFEFYCEVRAGFRSNHVASLPSKSTSKFLGMEVRESTIFVREGDEGTIFIRPTWMIGCRSGSLAGCNLTVTATTPESDGCLPSTKVKDNCGIRINSNYWNQWHAITVSPDVTLERGVQTITQKLYLSTNQQHIFHQLWGNYQLQPIEVVISKNTSVIEGRICSLSNDPYLRDFKNRMLRFELGGVFTMFRSGIVEIQVQVAKCQVYSSGYCVCGAIVRVGRTAFMINHCNSSYWDIDYILCDDGGNIFDVKKRSEQRFEVFLPSGTKVILETRMSYRYNWMQIEIIPSIRDYAKTSGLCNNLTNDGVLDFPSRFWWWNIRRTLPTDEAYFKLWKLQPSNNRNLFVSESYEYAHTWESAAKYQYCSCNTENGIIEKITCNSDTTKDCAIDEAYKMFHKKSCISPSRKKRSIPTLKNSHTHQRRKRDVSWKNGWTEDRAVDYCIGLFNNSQAIDRCDEIKGLDIDGAVQTCITDIQLSGNEDFALSSISSVSSQCLYEARMNRTLREETVKDNKSILELVKEVSCPGECSAQGRCDKGKCICNSEYIGSDCSLPLNTEPLAHSLQGDGYCDMSVEDCTEVAVFGGSFVDHDQTGCKLFPFEIKNDQLIVSEDPDITTAIFESIGEVTCRVLSKRLVDEPVIDETLKGYKVSVSNNGENYSQQLNFIIYNTECMNCTRDNVNTMMCSFSPNHCIMNNICYGHGSVYNIGDKDYMCRANGNGKAWLPIPVQCRSTNQLYLPFTNVNNRLVTNGQSSLSDRFMSERWYGSEHYIIPNSPPGLFHCGTIFPIYLKESPAPSGNIENVTACVQGNTVCEFEIEIQALVCSPTLTVYNLLRPSVDSAAYCLDTVAMPLV